MFRLLSRQAVKAFPRPASRQIHNMRLPYTGPPSYDTIAQRFSSDVDPQTHFTCKRQQKAKNRGEFIDKTNQKKRKSKCITSYCNMTQDEADMRLGFRMEFFEGITVARMLAEAKYKPREDVISKTKEKVYGNIVEYLVTEGYPEKYEDFNEANVSDLVLYTIGPILSSFKCETGRIVRLRREKEIISMDGDTGGKEEFIVVDVVAVAEEQFVIVEGRGSSLRQTQNQCLLSMKDMRDHNGGGEVYGFTTIGESWRMFKYDGVSFWKTERMETIFETMGEDKERWMKDYSVVVDCINVALINAGIVQK